MIATPILFTIFNRLDTAQQVFEQIRKAQPKKLYIASDGPRSSKPGEAALVEKIRTTIFSQIDWDCDVKTLLRNENIGCKMALSGAISWLFENEEEGIILEDDCVPNQSFFPYCEKMLQTYRNDSRIMVVSGTNYLHEYTHQSDSVFFMRYYAIWGWATWRRAWKQYDMAMSDWPSLKNTNALSRIFGPVVASFYEQLFDEIAIHHANTWDIQWTYSCLFNNGLSVVPSKNLITNIGTDGTHTEGKSPAKPTEILDISHLTLPLQIFPHLENERLFFSMSGASNPHRHAAYLVKKYVKSILGVKSLKKR